MVQGLLGSLDIEERGVEAIADWVRALPGPIGDHPVFHQVTDIQRTGHRQAGHTIREIELLIMRS